MIKKFTKLMMPALMFIALIGIQPAQAQTGKIQWQAKWLRIGYREDSIARPAQYFQKHFVSDKKIKAATLYITAQGLYEANINGKRASASYLTPGWTDYNKRLQYQEYNVTELLQKGDNHLTVAVGDGWFRGYVGFDNIRNRYGKQSALLCQLELTFTDGSRSTIISDESWKSGEGPIRASSINNGEIIDATKTLNCDQPVKIADIGYGTLIPTESNPITKHETFKPVKIITTPLKETVMDFGQNLVGWISIKLKGQAGDTIRIRHAEVLDKIGNFYTANLRNAQAMATYILKSNEEMIFEPHFTYYGFRYASIEWIRGKKAIIPDAADYDPTAIALYSNMKPTGTFTCSNPDINQLQHNIVWGQKGNFLDIPTDCPQRDERLGWVGDAQVFSRTASFNFDVNSFFSKWMKDVAADQQPDGSVTHVVPDILGGFGGSAGWSDVATVVPWNMYVAYGDKAMLERQYPSMQAWVGFMEKNSTNNLWNKGFHFGDWLSYRSPDDDGSDAITDKYEIAQCFYAYSTELLIKAAKALGKTDDVTRYEALLKNIKDAYFKEYVTANGRVMSNTQTAYVLALNFDMLPEANRATAAKFLVNNIKSYGNHLTTGFLGTPYLCHVLSRFGYTDVAYSLLLQDTYPSWLYPVKRGATTIWERWDGIKRDGSFQTTTMNSFNHYAYGAIGDWMYRVIAGLDTEESPDGVGYKKIVIKPHPGGKLTWVNLDYESRQGKISVHWKIANNKFLMDVVIPKGTTAQINTPDINGANYKVQNVSSGVYHFEN
jgi:alpha-L-rhamnosidase